MKQRLYILILFLSLVFSAELATAQYTDMVCSGETRVYQVSGAQGTTFTWAVEGGEITKNWGDSIEVTWGNTPGVYSMQATPKSIYGCSGSPMYAEVKVTKPVVDLGLDKITLCEGEKIELNAGGIYLSYYWNTGDTSKKIEVSTSGLYKVTGTNEIGCKVSDSALITVAPLPVVNLGPDVSLCWTETVELDAKNEGAIYKWSTNEVERIITAHTGAGIIWVKVTTESGCSGSDTIVIEPCDYSKYADMIPNTFTPNGDQDNDTWFIPWLYSVPNARVEIFDRWGQSVYMSKNGLPPAGWDGTRNGKKLPMDSYYYVIDLKDGSKPLSGTVTIIR
jgi:gliding motility-associated-like protein